MTESTTPSTATDAPRCVTRVDNARTGHRVSCETHGSEQLDGYTLGAESWRAWTCDHGLGWRFILDHVDEPPRMTDLSGLKAALTGAVEHAHYAGEHGNAPAVFRYHGNGRTERLTWDYIPGTGGYVINDTAENTVPHTYPQYQVAGADGTRYLTMTVPLAEC